MSSTYDPRIVRSTAQFTAVVVVCLGVLAEVELAPKRLTCIALRSDSC